MLVIHLVFLWISLVFSPVAVSAQTITFAVLAKRGKEAAIKRWQPLVDYLHETTPYTIKLEPLPFEALKEAVQKGQADLVLANPAMYMEFKACCGLSPIVTMKNLKFGKTYTRFGGVIFTRSEHRYLSTLEDFKKVKPLVGTVDPASFGGWLMQWREFMQAGLKRGRDFKVQFYKTHDAVVYAVLKGVVDVGCVRTDILEAMSAEGKIRLKDLKLIHPQRAPGFDLWLSTPIYPEWPLARAPTLKDEVAEVLASVLLALPKDSEVARATGAAWTIPHNYQPVHECLRELGVGPYAELKAQLMYEAREKYLKLIISLALATIIAALTAFYIFSLNKRLSRAYQELKKHRNHLESLVSERTLHLEKTTRNLEEEVEERRRAERATSEEKERLAVILRSLTDAVIVTDITGRITLLNPAAERLLEISAQIALGKSFCELISLKTKEKKSRLCRDILHWASVENKLISFKEAELKLPSGRTLLVEGVATPVHSEANEVLGSVIVLRDITARKRLEEEALKASRLETLSLLASGVAHDFNNLLSAIVGYLNVIRLKLKDRELEETVNKAERACFTAKTLTRELLTYTTGGGPVKRMVSLVECIQENISFALSGSKIKAEIDFPLDLWPTEVDPDQMSICLHNILLNARQVMPEGGKVYIRARNVKLDSPNPFGLPPGPYLEIEIEDTGPGIPENILPHIFEPFFTTKEGGSGLGLFSCHRIVEAHNGRILAESPPGKGAIFRILLPANPEGKVETHEKPYEAGTKTCSARILIMDDEEGVREPVAEILRLSGFEVETAENGERALTIFKQALDAGTPFDLVILDLTVPGGLGGRDLLPKLRKLFPEVKAIVVSGYSQDPVMEKYKEFGFNGAIIKPFSHQALLATIERILSE
ncbi:PhnD/SsuA/transferrin family substrate-binding protein [Thermosulfurimonas dismutans]|uniref:histidine kinase n=1 Tax=Thermosulfurimonas dismutans TaxID=999894 RepID=A0A179D7U2_9BACT|nr:PhnD/SsuA/transferrin family substrate-binding protein [Thermosulfurimonas dismutans]OAQ21799.1 hypothetical protein TDIS_0317 [Thermosulfurimonas dismutans]